jgi:AcrR family transcriptional regulator
MTLTERPDTPLRRDVQLRRDRLIRAAVELYASDGFDVPLEKVADRAGVGRATLYRNFPDREALSAAVLQVIFDELAAEVAQWANRDDAFFLGIRALASKAAASSGFEKIAPLHRHTPSLSARVRHGMEKLLAAPLLRAKAAGLIRPDFEISDIHLLIVMVAAGALDHEGNTAASIERALKLLMRGLAP